jgi:outer membrane protein
MKRLTRSLLIFFLTLSQVPSGYCADASKTAAGTFAAPQPLPADGKPLTLEECYRLALKQSELIAIDAERIKQAEAHFLSSFEELLPEVSFSRQDRRQNSKMSPTSNHGFDQKFVFSQPLFMGFKEFAGMAAGHYETKQRKNERVRAEQLLFEDVSNAFYLLIEKQEDLKVLVTINDSLSQRVKELTDRVNIGRSRASEVVNTQTQLYTFAAIIESIKAQELVARELLNFLTGVYVEKVAEAGLDIKLKTESEYLQMAFSREDVMAAYYGWRSDEKQILVTQSGFLPEITLDANRYGHRSSSPTDSRWDAAITVDIPIFEEHTTYGQMKEAIAIARESQLRFNRTKRIALQEIYNDYVNLHSAISIREAYKKAVGSAKENFSLQTRDYQQNLVSNLDVLAAIQSLGDTQRGLIHSEYECKRLYWKLMTDIGDVPGDKK